MTLHHQKHHQTYVNGLNSAEESLATAATPRERIALQAAYKFNGGGKYPRLSERKTKFLIIQRLGHINHSLFWKNMAPAAHGAKHGAGCGGVLKPGPLADAINRDFGSVDEMKKQFNAATVGIQGSGWGWLVLKSNGHLAITTTPNQDPVIGEAITHI